MQVEQQQQPRPRNALGSVWSPARDEALAPLYGSQIAYEEISDQIAQVDPHLPRPTIKGIRIRAIKLGLKRPRQSNSDWERDRDISAAWSQARKDLVACEYPLARISKQELARLVSEAPGKPYAFTSRNVGQRARMMGLVWGEQISTDPKVPQWCEARDEVLRPMWAAGARTSDIVEEVNKIEPERSPVSISSVKARALNLGLPPRPQPVAAPKASKAQPATCPRRTTAVRPEKPRELTPPQMDAAYATCIGKVRRLLQQRRSLNDIDQETIMSIARKSGLDRFKIGFQSERIVRVQIGAVRAERCGMLEISA